MIFVDPLVVANKDGAMKTAVRFLVLTGLAAGAVLGMAGSIVSAANVRSLSEDEAS